MLSGSLLAHVASPAGANAHFAKLSENFIHETLALSPAWASGAGYHKRADFKTGRTLSLTRCWMT